MGSANDIDTAKADFKAAWEELKAKTSPRILRRLQGHEPGSGRGPLCANYLPGLSSGSLSYRRRLRVPNDQGFVRFATCISWYSRLA